MLGGLLSARRVGAAIAVACSLLPATTASAGSVRVPPGFFGMNFQLVDTLDASGREAQLSRIESLGIRTIRINVSWQVVEPASPSGAREYRWERYDAIVGDAARHGIRVEPTLVQTPWWNTANDPIAELRCEPAQSEAPLAIAPYADFAAAVAARYGPGGTFWSQRPDLPARPFDEYEIWNEPNLNGGWCPTPSPEQYAAMFAGALQRIHAVDRSARVIVGGLAQPVPGYSEGIAVDRFLARMIAARPALRRGAAAIAVHTYPEPSAVSEVLLLRLFRGFLQRGGVPNETPMIVNEVGWPTSGSEGAIGEARRERGYAAITSTMARTNCNVSEVQPHTWITRELDPGNVQDWFGIADPVTAEPTPAATAYARGIRLQRGELSAEAERATIRACDGMPEPDQDGEGVPDERDYFPLDPSHARLRGRSGRLPAAERSVRITAAWTSVSRARGAERRRLHRAYRRLVRRFMPCRRRLVARARRLERKILSAPPALRIERRSRHVARVRRCRAAARRGQ